MPRLLPRLVQNLTKEPLESAQHRIPVQTVRYRRPHQSKRSLPTRPSFLPTGRTQSILRDVDNPIANPELYTIHKEPAPRIRVEQLAHEPGCPHHPREMDAQERDWWASPYLRMLSSPVRICWVTWRHFPSDLLIRMVPMRLPGPRKEPIVKYLLPDGLEHPRFKKKKSGRASYILCWKAALESFNERGISKRIISNLHMPSRLAEHIGHLLRVRILQELEFLADQLSTRPLGAKSHPILRRLTRREFQTIRETGMIEDDSAVAVIIVPPLNRDPATRQRPLPSSSPAFVDKEIPPKLPKRSVLPISTLHPTSPASAQFADMPTITQAQVPLYNGVSLFPSRSQRAALHERLLRLLSIEQRARCHDARKNPASSNDLVDLNVDHDRQASHAFLLRSDSETVLRADAAATAIALWRLRMWEGAGLDGAAPKGEDWILT